MRLLNAIEDYIAAKKAERLSNHTLDDYSNTFRKFSRHTGNPQVNTIKEAQVIDFLASSIDVSKKTLRNYHAGLSSLWNYMVEKGLVKKNIIRQIRAPRSNPKPVVPYSRNDIISILSARSKDSFLALRDRAMILSLLDCGLRASELCSLKKKDIDTQKRIVLVRSGKGGKSRRIPFSDATKKALELYLFSKGNISNDDFVFTTTRKRPVDRSQLLKLIVRFGQKSGVDDCNVHRFRHTFAIQFLRNGGNIYTLQALLGHSSLDMVKRYLAISQIDIERDHLKASPVLSWEL